MLPQSRYIGNEGHSKVETGFPELLKGSGSSEDELNCTSFNFKVFAQMFNAEMGNLWVGADDNGGKYNLWPFCIFFSLFDYAILKLNLPSVSLSFGPY